MRGGEQLVTLSEEPRSGSARRSRGCRACATSCSSAIRWPRWSPIASCSPQFAAIRLAGGPRRSTNPFWPRRARTSRRFYDKWIRRPGASLVPHEVRAAGVRPGDGAGRALPVLRARRGRSGSPGAWRSRPWRRCSTALRSSPRRPRRPSCRASRAQPVLRPGAAGRLRVDRARSRAGAGGGPHVCAGRLSATTCCSPCSTSTGRASTGAVTRSRDWRTTRCAAWPDHLYVNLVAGDALRTLGQHDVALPYLETAARASAARCRDPRRVRQRARRAAGLHRAAALATSLVAVAPEDASHRLFLATILTMAGDRKKPATGDPCARARHRGAASLARVRRRRPRGTAGRMDAAGGAVSVRLRVATTDGSSPHDRRREHVQAQPLR